MDALLAEWAPIAARLDALDTALRDRANALAWGLGEGRNVWFNAMLGRDTGHPWVGVDYSALRRALHVDVDLRSRVWRMRQRLWRAMFRRYFPGIGDNRLAA